MQQEQKELTFEESVREIMRTLPPVIRDYFARSAYAPIIKNLVLKYHLRVDQGAILEREVIACLIGVEAPEQLIGTLRKEAKVPEEQMRDIVDDLNNTIFAPLREKMRQQSVGSQSRDVKRSDPEPGRLTSYGSPQNNDNAEGGKESYFHLENRISATPQTRQQSHSNEQKTEKGVPVNHRLENEKLLGDHEEPHIEFHGTVQPPPITRYNVDPYREPIDEDNL